MKLVTTDLSVWAGCDFYLPFLVQRKDTVIVGEDFYSLVNSHDGSYAANVAYQNGFESILQKCIDNNLPIPKLDMYYLLPFSYGSYFSNYSPEPEKILSYRLCIYNSNNTTGNRLLQEQYDIRANFYFMKMQNAQNGMDDNIKDELYAGVSDVPTVIVNDKHVLHIPNNITANWDIGKLEYEMFMIFGDTENLMLSGDINILGKYYE